MLGWLFRRRQPPDVPPTLVERLLDVERQVKALRLEWDDTFERLDRVAGRLAKRAERASALTADRPSPGEAAPVPLSRVALEVARRRAGNRNGPAQTGSHGE